MKTSRQAKLLAKEEQAEKRAAKIFNAFSKESYKKLKDKLLPDAVKTPKCDKLDGYNFTESTDASPGANLKTNFNKSMKARRKFWIKHNFIPSNYPVSQF